MVLNTYCREKTGGARLSMNNQIEEMFSYHSPKEGQQEKYEALREKAKELAYLIEEVCPVSREKSIAITNLQTTVMMANASIAIHTK